MPDPAARPTPIEISDATAQRRIAVMKRWDRYDGDHPDSLTLDEADVSDNVTINHAGTIVDTGVDFLFGGSVDFGVMRRLEQRDDSGRRQREQHVEAEEWLSDVWDANHKDTLLRKLGMAGAIENGIAVKIVPAESAPGVVDPQGMHRVIILDTAWLAIRTKPNDIDTVTGYAIDTPELDGYGNVIRVWREQHDQAADGTWTVQWLFTREHVWEAGMNRGREVRWEPDPARPDVVAWPHPFPAVAHAQNLPRPHDVWGMSDLPDDVLKLNEAINRVASNEQKTIRNFAHPLVWSTPGPGGDVKSIQGAIDAHIGGVLCLPEGTQLLALQMQAEGPAAARLYREALEDKLYERARVPRVAAGKVDDIGAMAGVALLMLYRPLVAKTETKRDTYGDLLVEANKRLLAIATFGDYGTLEVPLIWPDTLPKDEKTEVDVAQGLRDLGASLRTVFERLGIDWEQERDRIAEEAADPMGDARGLLDRIAELEAHLHARGGPDVGQVTQDDPAED